MNIIECKKLSLGYSGSVYVKDVSFALEKGRYLCIIGENGSGKSTLLKGILGLLPPLKGSVELSIKRSELGYLPQLTQTRRDFPATAAEVVLSGLAATSGMTPFYKRSERALALACMEKTGTENLFRRRFGELSEGQKRRVLLSRALISGRKLLVLDEPVAGLDPEHALELYKIIENLKSEKMTMLIVTHDLDAARNADMLLCLNAGETVYYGPPRRGKGDI